MGNSNRYFTISDLAKELDVKKSHIRFCEDHGFISHKVAKLKRRVYNEYDRERLKLVFHFVLIGYSKEQIVDLIGLPDENLDENEQLLQGIEYGEKKLKALEKQKEQQSFTKQTSIMNEIVMVHEYLRKIKNIQSGVVEKPEAKTSLKFEKRIQTATEPERVIKAISGEKQMLQPLGAISLFVVGFVLVIIIGSYFYYQFGQKEAVTTRTNLKEPSRSETYRVNRESTPLDPSVKAQTMESLEQKMPEAVQKKSAPTVIQRNEAMQTELEPGLFESKSSMENQPDVGKEDSVSKNNAIQAGIAQKAASTPIEKALPATDGVSLVSEKQKIVDLQAKATSETVVTKETAEKSLTAEALPAATGGDTLSATGPAAVKEKEADAPVKVPSTKLEKEKEQIVTIERMGKQEDRLSRLKSFLNLYCRTYTNRNLDKFITFFTSDATENNRPFQELVPEYRKNMENAESFTYRIEIISYTKRATETAIVMNGKYFIRYRLQGGDWEENSGSISMELLEAGDSFLVRKLTY